MNELSLHIELQQVCNLMSHKGCNKHYEENCGEDDFCEMVLREALNRYRNNGTLTPHEQERLSYDNVNGWTSDYCHSRMTYDHPGECCGLCILGYTRCRDVIKDIFNMYDI